MSTVIDKLFPNSFKRNYEDLNLKFAVYYSKLTPNQLTYIEDAIEDVINKFQEHFIRLDSDLFRERSNKINIHVFSSRDKYVRHGSEIPINSDNGGITYVTSEGKKSTSDVYVYANPNVHNLKHEIVHGLMCCSIGKLPAALVEGIADYVEHGLQDVPRMQLKNAYVKLGNKADLDSILKIESGDLVYYGGLLLVSFFEKHHPKYLDDLLIDCFKGNVVASIDAREYKDEFENWLGTLGLGLTDKDAFEVQIGNIVKTGVYEARVVDENKRKVGYFPAVEFMYFHNTFRVYCHGTGDYYDVSPEYTYIKITDDVAGVLCDKEGNIYYETKEFKLQTKRMFSETLPSTKLVEKFSKLVRGASGEEMALLFKALEKNKELEMSEIEKRLAESSSSIDYLKSIDLRKVRSSELSKAFSVGGILKIATEDVSGKMYSAASVFYMGRKIGELPSSTGLFTKTEDGTLSFVYNDSPANTFVKYNAKTYVTKFGEHLHFVSGVTGRDPPQLKLNRLFHVDSSYVDSEHLSKLRPKIEEDPEIKLAGKEYKLERGKLLDNKGTDRATDDIYEAVLKKGEEVLTIMRYVGMYSIGDYIFVHDFGRGRRHQLPANVNWLKLIKDEKDMIYLVPWILDESKIYGDIQIDPFLIHTYSDGYKSGLVDVAAYKIGTLFECRAKDGMVELYSTHGEYVGRMVSEQHNFMNDIFLSVDYNYSFVDFMSSRSPNVLQEEDYYRFTVGDGDFPTDKGYTNHQRIYIEV